MTKKSGVEYLAQHPGWKTVGQKHGARVKRQRRTVNWERLDASDVATILAALRLFQREYEDMDAVQVAEAWPEHFDAVDPEDVKPAPLGSLDIDLLCERINCAKKLALP